MSQHFLPPDCGCDPIGIFFPPCPRPGQIVWGPGGVSWQWMHGRWVPRQSACEPDCHPCPHPDPKPPHPVLRGPILGVIDGSDAEPGMVGEYMQNTVSQPITVPSGGAGTTVMISAIVLPAGDWDVQAQCFPETNVGIENLSFGLSPVPTGLSDGMVAGMATPDPSLLFALCPRARALVKVPTLLAFSVGIVATTGATGTLQFQTTARRMR